jgi:hypothetical protein
VRARTKVRVKLCLIETLGVPDNLLREAPRTLDGLQPAAQRDIWSRDIPARGDLNNTPFWTSATQTRVRNQISW